METKYFCPFCGTEAELKDEHADSYDENFLLTCKKCKTTCTAVRGHTPDEWLDNI